jgi:transposase
VTLVEAKLDALAIVDQRVRRLRTIPGVGPRLAELVVAVIDDPHRFQNAKQLGAYAGLVPKQYESGTMSCQGRITCHDAIARRAIFQRVRPVLERVLN